MRAVTWAIWATPTPTSARSRPLLSSTSRRWLSPARLATAAPRATPWAIWAPPTTPSARSRPLLSSTSRRWLSPARLATAAARATTWAIWAAPTPPSARSRPLLSSTSRRWPSPARLATAAARATTWAIWALPTRSLGAGRAAPSSSTSKRWPSPARLATAAARGATWAIWASPTTTLGAGRDAPLSSHQQALAISREIGDRRGEGNQPGQSGNAYYGLGQVEQRHRVLRAGAGYRPRDWRPPRRGQRPGQPGARLRRPGPGRDPPSTFHQQALAISREIGDRRAEGNHLGNRCSPTATSARSRPAVEFYQQAHGYLP